MKTLSSIEPLEARIAPAMLLSPTKVRYTDFDGDIVTVKFSKGEAGLENFAFVPAGRGEQLQEIFLAGDAAEFAGADLTIRVTRVVGDGSVHIGRIDAAGIDLGTVRIAGDLGRIAAGDADVATAGLDFLKVQSLGRLGTATQAAGEAGLASQIAGDLGTLKIAGAMKDASLSAMGDTNGVGGNIGSIIIRGSLKGGEGEDSGTIHSTGGIGSVQIDGSIIGAAGKNSGAILSGRSLGTLTVDGSIQSGGGAGSGSIRAGENIASIAVGDGLIGSSAQPVLLTAGGAGIGQVWISGHVEYAKIMAGYDRAGIAINGDAQIGQIAVKGNWVASSAVAGSISGPDGLFGTADDAIRFPHSNTVIASIATIKIAGHARGTDGPAADHFGFVAEEIGKVKIGTRLSQLSPGPGNDHDPAATQLTLGKNGDFRIMEVSSLAPPPSLLAAVSRKIHGAAGAFDIDLPLSATTGLESRAGGSLTPDWIQQPFRGYAIGLQP